MMKILMLGVVMLIAACAPTAPAATPATPAPTLQTQSQALPAPTPADVIRIGVEQNGQVVQVRAGERFAVALVGVPTAGYVWSPVVIPAFLQKVGEGGGPTTAAQGQPGFTGGNHWEVFYFTASAAGRGELKLEQRRPWETSEPASGTFSVTIEAR